MSTIRLDIEHPLKSTSRNIVWKLIGTADGLSRWIADSVKLEGDTITIAWGDEWRHHETRSGTIICLDRYDRIRWRWDDDRADSTYVEIRMERSSLSDEFTLHITDFSLDDDIDWLRSVWQHNFKMLGLRNGV